ncbi:hypothetical protein K502DRAFT_324480 [Neoconidiobolus thromboides FSU 785]|nr:hypothetical protein K502DRAFT_324480 [Neoconidiobolus thromboides FSU 785]
MSKDKLPTKDYLIKQLDTMIKGLPVKNKKVSEQNETKEGIMDFISKVRRTTKLGLKSKLNPERDIKILKGRRGDSAIKILFKRLDRNNLETEYSEVNNYNGTTSAQQRRSKVELKEPVVNNITTKSTRATYTNKPNDDHATSTRTINKDISNDRSAPIGRTKVSETNFKKLGEFTMKPMERVTSKTSIAPAAKRANIDKAEILNKSNNISCKSQQESRNSMTKPSRSSNPSSNKGYNEENQYLRHKNERGPNPGIGIQNEITNYANGYSEIKQTEKDKRALESGRTGQGVVGEKGEGVRLEYNKLPKIKKFTEEAKARIITEKKELEGQKEKAAKERSNSGIVDPLALHIQKVKQHPLLAGTRNAEVFHDENQRQDSYGNRLDANYYDDPRSNINYNAGGPNHSHDGGRSNSNYNEDKFNYDTGRSSYNYDEGRDNSDYNGGRPVVNYDAPRSNTNYDTGRSNHYITNSNSGSRTSYQPQQAYRLHDSDTFESKWGKPKVRTNANNYFANRGDRTPYHDLNGTPNNQHHNDNIKSGLHPTDFTQANSGTYEPVYTNFSSPHDGDTTKSEQPIKLDYPAPLPRDTPENIKSLYELYRVKAKEIKDISTKYDKSSNEFKLAYMQAMFFHIKCISFVPHADEALKTVYQALLYWQSLLPTTNYLLQTTIYHSIHRPLLPVLYLVKAIIYRNIVICGEVLLNNSEYEGSGLKEVLIEALDLSRRFYRSARKEFVDLGKVKIYQPVFDFFSESAPKYFPVDFTAQFDHGYLFFFLRSIFTINIKTSGINFDIVPDDLEKYHVET